MRKVHFPLRRLDAEAVRDGMLAVSADIDLHPGGAYVPTRRNAEGAVEVDKQGAGARRRSSCAAAGARAAAGTCAAAGTAASSGAAA